MSSWPFASFSLPLLIDGGLSNQLEGQGYELDHPLWTAKLLENAPQAIVQAHLAYLEAGAQCITTASYQASFPGLVEAGYSKHQAKLLILKSVSLAQEAIHQYLIGKASKKRPLIAASIGPYGAYLADGSEYRGDYGISDESLHHFHQERIQLLDGSNADILACETIPGIQEASVLSKILSGVNKPAWVSFSCKNDTQLNDGSNIQKLVSIFRDHPKVFALGVNCTRPEYITGLIRQMKMAKIDKEIIVYPNSGETYQVKSKSWLASTKTKSYLEMTKEWISSGAQLIGGCCRIGPKQISQMQKAMIVVVILLLSGVFSCQQPNDLPDKSTSITAIEADTNEVRNLIINSFDDIWSGLDTNKISQYHTDDFILLENGIVWNNDSIRNYLNQTRPIRDEKGYQRLNLFDFIKTVHRDNSIWVAYNNYGTWVKGKDTLRRAHWLESAVAIKKDGQWKLEQLHSTRVVK